MGNVREMLNKHKDKITLPDAINKKRIKRVVTRPWQEAIQQTQTENNDKIPNHSKAIEKKIKIPITKNTAAKSSKAKNLPQQETNNTTSTSSTEKVTKSIISENLTSINLNLKQYLFARKIGAQLSSNEDRALNYIIEKTQYGELENIPISQIEFVKQGEVTDRTVGSSLKGLKEKKFIEISEGKTENNRKVSCFTLANFLKNL